MMTGGYETPEMEGATPPRQMSDLAVCNLGDQFLRSGPFLGWHQARKFFVSESGRVAPGLEITL